MAAANTSLFLKRFAWGVSGGSITGLQNFLKDALTIGKAKHASSSSAEDDAGWSWYLMLFIFLAVATAFGGLLLLTACMKRYDATYSSAMFVGSFVVSASVMSAVHYRTFQNLVHVWNYVMYPMGLVVLMAGVLILVHETKEHSAEDNEDVEETNGHATLANLTSNDLVRRKTSHASVLIIQFIEFLTAASLKSRNNFFIPTRTWMTTSRNFFDDNKLTSRIGLAEVLAIAAALSS